MMTEFLGIKNVIDATPIFGKDGIADGFEVIYLRDTNIRGKKVQRQCKQTVYVREFDCNSVGNDGCIRGFGKAIPMYKRVCASEKAERASRAKNAKVNLEVVAQILGKKVAK